ncbi:MAG: YXWGXW repeat-containing protein [Betaproteobacteria bacterium]|nr:YXWGXW repeat-containing protein [Betaproteobacteria bacterium]
MKTHRPHRIVLLAAALSSLALSGCVVTASTPSHVRHGGYDHVIVVPPPPPQYEVVHVAPQPGYIWIGGYWGWNGRAHHWVPGRWDAPRHGHRWEPHRWEQHGKEWRERPGRWERDDRAHDRDGRERHRRG